MIRGLYPHDEHTIALSGIVYFIILWVWIAAFSIFGETLAFSSVWPFSAFHLFFVFPRPSRFTVTSLMIIVFRRSREIFSAKKTVPALNYRKTKLATVTELLPARWSDVSLQELVETKTREIRRDKQTYLQTNLFPLKTAASESLWWCLVLRWMVSLSQPIRPHYRLFLRSVTWVSK